MNLYIYELIELLEKSVEKNGEKQLTNKWLLNILRKVEKEVSQQEDEDYGIDYWDIH